MRRYVDDWIVLKIVYLGFISIGLAMLILGFIVYEPLLETFIKDAPVIFTVDFAVMYGIVVGLFMRNTKRRLWRSLVFLKNRELDLLYLAGGFGFLSLLLGDSSYMLDALTGLCLGFVIILFIVILQVLYLYYFWPKDDGVPL
jgi:hypothetical protein